MSTQKGNAVRTRPQKYKNSSQFKNNKFDSSKKTQLLNKMEMTCLCSKCEEVISWKIRYKKYKPLTVPGFCIKCKERTVKAAYHNVCTNCSEELKICAKCTESTKEGQEA